MSLVDDINKDAQQYGGSAGSGSTFQFERAGTYRMRILTKPKVLATHFFGRGNPSVICVGKDNGCKFHGDAMKDKDGKEAKPSIKLMTYVILRDDNNSVKLAELPLSISYSLDNLQNDEDFKYNDYPLPFDVKIKYDPNNPDPKAKYQLLPTPQFTPLTDEEQVEFDKKMEFETPEQYIEKRKQKQLEKSSARAPEPEPQEEINPDDIPF